jgi:hypothetical protein
VQWLAVVDGKSKHVPALPQTPHYKNVYLYLNNSIEDAIDQAWLKPIKDKENKMRLIEKNNGELLKNSDKDERKKAANEVARSFWKAKQGVQAGVETAKREKKEKKRKEKKRKKMMAWAKRSIKKEQAKIDTMPKAGYDKASEDVLDRVSALLQKEETAQSAEVQQTHFRVILSDIRNLLKLKLLGTHTALTLHSHCTQYVLSLHSYCTRTVLHCTPLYSYCTHTVLILYSYCTHTVLVLCSYSPT